MTPEEAGKLGFGLPEVLATTNTGLLAENAALKARVAGLAAENARLAAAQAPAAEPAPGPA